jgi:hypothetical protein
MRYLKALIALIGGAAFDQLGCDFRENRRRVLDSREDGRCWEVRVI